MQTNDSLALHKGDIARERGNGSALGVWLRSAPDGTTKAKELNSAGPEMEKEIGKGSQRLGVPENSRQYLCPNR